MWGSNLDKGEDIYRRKKETGEINFDTMFNTSYPKYYSFNM